MVLRQKGSDGINEASRLRGDNVRASDGDIIHSHCRKTYTNAEAISDITKVNQIVVLLATSVRRHRRSNVKHILSGNFKRSQGPLEDIYS